MRLLPHEIASPEGHTKEGALEIATALGLVSLGESHLSNVIKYIAAQKDAGACFRTRVLAFRRGRLLSNVFECRHTIS